MNHSKSNNPMKRFLLSVALVLSSMAVALSQTHFVPVFPGHGVDHMNFYALTATIDGVALQTGDEIAVFDDTYCVGVAVVVTPGVMLSVPASKDDPVTVGVVDGYRTGNTATFKMWDASGGIEVTNISITLVGGALTFDAGTSAFVNLAGIGNTAPVFTSVPILTATEGVLYSYTVQATDADLDPLIYDAVTLPSWLNFNPTTQVLSGTPGSADGGSSYSVSLRVTDSHVFVTQDFQIAVSEASNKLVFTTPAQILYTGFPSQVITVELQDGANNPLNVVSNTTVQLTTSSATGAFSVNRNTWVNITSVTIPAGSHAVSFYYKDNTVGSPTITAAENPDQGWTNALQTHTVQESSISHVMHLAVGTVRTSALAIPVDGQLSFNAYIKSRPGEILNETSTECDYQDGYWWIQCSSFPTGWAAGETIHVDFTDAGSGEVGSVEMDLTNDAADDAGLVILASLQPPVVTSINTVTSNDLRFTLQEMTGNITFNVYRDTVAFFIPDKVGGLNRIATHMLDEDIGTAGIQWTDLDVVGNANTNYFYIFTAAIGGFESDNSTTTGKFDYNLITTAKTNFNEIALPLNLPGITNAAQLRAAIPGCTSVAYWNAATQGYKQYSPSIPPTNFTVQMGYPYYVNVTSNAIFTLTGEIVEPTFNLITTTKTNFNEVMLTLDKTSIRTASQLRTDIPYCTSVARWNASTQGYKQYSPSIPPTNFNVRVGYPYYVNVTASTVWPAAGGKKSALSGVDDRIEKDCPPHLVFGKIKITATNVKESDINFTAQRMSFPDEKLVPSSAGCMIQDGFWVVQCHTFPTGWVAGETIKVVFTDKRGLQLDEVEVLLTNNAVDEAREIIFNESSADYLLMQNMPNPFSESTRIQYQIPEEGQVEIDVYTLTGVKIRTLINEYKPVGTHEVTWDGNNERGHRLSDGMYLYTLRCNGRIFVNRALLLQ
jgi:hypothetical protein